ncbi:cation transporter dimerization domain-containing protein [Methylobacterium oxalidis]|uniref:cation transporter dimerization domain-containing protein n=1 Tax=Methylobacterium oxalidis TaxID=944322 RepID=UPI0033145207
MRPQLPNTHHRAFVAGLFMLALAAPEARAQGAPVRPLGAYEAAHGVKGSEVASLITRIIERQLLTIPGVRSVHDMHVRTISSGIDQMSAHLVVTDMAEAARVLKAVQRIMAAEFNTRHVTVQVENEILQEKEKVQKT